MDDVMTSFFSLWISKVDRGVCGRLWGVITPVAHNHAFLGARPCTVPSTPALEQPGGLPWVISKHDTSRSLNNTCAFRFALFRLWLEP